MTKTTIADAELLTDEQIDAIYDALPKYGLEQEAYYSRTAIRIIGNVTRALTPTNPPSEERIEQVARAMFDAREVRRLSNPHIAPAKWEDHRAHYMEDATAALEASRPAISNEDAEWRWHCPNCRRESSSMLSIAPEHCPDCGHEGSWEAANRPETSEVTDAAT